MKRLMTGFTAFVALMAMSFTFASKTQVAKTIVKDAPYEACFTSVSVATAFSTVLFSQSFTSPYGGSTLTSGNPLFPFTLLTGSVVSVGGVIANPKTVCVWTPFAPTCCYVVKYQFGKFKVITVIFGRWI